MKRIIKNDNVRVIAGKCKRQDGIVMQVFPKTNKALVKGINIVKRHKKNDDPNKRITEKEEPIDLSNLALIDPKNKEKTIKVSFIFKDKVKIRVNRKTKEKV